MTLTQQLLRVIDHTWPLSAPTTTTYGRWSPSAMANPDFLRGRHLLRRRGQPGTGEAMAGYVLGSIPLIAAFAVGMKY